VFAELHELQQALTLQALALVVLLRHEVVGGRLVLRGLLGIRLRLVQLSRLLLPLRRLLTSWLGSMSLALSRVLRCDRGRRPSLAGLLRGLRLWLSLLWLSLLRLTRRGLRRLSLLAGGSLSLGLGLMLGLMLGLDGGHLRLLQGELVRGELARVVGILAAGQGAVRHLLLDRDLLGQEGLLGHSSASVPRYRSTAQHHRASSPRDLLPAGGSGGRAVARSA